MPAIDFVVESEISGTPRSRQLEAIFDVPRQQKARLHFKGDLPIDEKPWSIGLIVGPSGCGKSSILKQAFPPPDELAWDGAGVIDDFAGSLSMEEISSVCQAVGFNTVPAWMRPYRVLSNGERFRVELARRLIESKSTIVMDEFTSVVDRRVAQIGSHCVQKYVRKTGKQFVAAACHYDIIDWLQPDWTLEPATMTFTWRELRRRPGLEATIRRVHWDRWRIFAPFHYLSADLLGSAKCFGLEIEGQLAAFCGVIHQPHARVQGLWRISRLVTLPDFQGLGLAFAMIERLGALYAARNKRLRIASAAPGFVRSLCRTPVWRRESKMGRFSQAGRTSTSVGRMGGRPATVFEYVGARHPDADLARFMVA